jgi:hypothetical protein
MSPNFALISALELCEVCRQKVTMRPYENRLHDLVPYDFAIFASFNLFNNFFEYSPKNVPLRIVTLPHMKMTCVETPQTGPPLVAPLAKEGPPNSGLKSQISDMLSLMILSRHDSVSMSYSFPHPLWSYCRFFESPAVPPLETVSNS